jgi:isoamylase
MTVLNPGTATPLGLSILPKGVNFAFHSTSEEVTLALFHVDEEKPFLIIPLNPSKNKTGSTWHVFVCNLSPPFDYAIQTKESNGHFLLDPYAKNLSTPFDWENKETYQPRGRCLPKIEFNWEDSQKPQRPFKDWIIYEMHVRGFTEASSKENKGTFLAMIEKIPHLVSLGVNAVELLPVFEFNPWENKRKNPLTGETLCNFWGYSTVSFFSLMKRYAVENPILEFKTLVRELHKQGIAVILDVVYNHTAEGSDKEGDPCYSFKGLDKKGYYLFDQNGAYSNYSGTGNTVNSNHPITSKLIVDSLSYFAEEMQIDAFRFDLASILTRGLDGQVLEEPPVLKAIHEAPALQKTLFIAEAWDAAGLYQVGSFPGKERWAEWNGRYRDSVRQFLKGTNGLAGDFAQAITGSQNLYWKFSPSRSVNFITAHDGYTLHDLVSYQDKHNKANGENNQDGANDNHSWNCGAEGETEDKDILSIRNRQMKNFVLALMVSLGTPMLLMGDEYAHTRKGNNNPYCQDNEMNYFLWDALKQNQEIFRFFQNLINFRKKHASIFCKNAFLSNKDVSWHGSEPLKPNWNPESRFVAYTLKNSAGKDCLIAFNADHDPVTFHFPSAHGWIRIVDTALPAAQNFQEKNREVLKGTYTIQPYSSLIWESE